jgi:acyl transferase domain-containing protein
LSQEAVIRAALADAGVPPGSVDYVEAHGTGTSLGDPIELGALGAALCGERTRANPLRVGSVKTNIGHLEGAAGMAGLIKTVLSLENGTIPPQLHFRPPNPYVDWANGRSGGDDPPVARVKNTASQGSVLGFSGTNAT